MYYKIKIGNDRIDIISEVKRKGKDREYLYVTQDELSLLNPDIIVDNNKICNNLSQNDLKNA